MLRKYQRVSQFTSLYPPHPWSPNARRAASSQKGPVGKAILVNLILAAFGAILSQILPLAFLAEEAVVAVGLNLGFFTSATFFKVQDEDGAWY